MITKISVNKCIISSKQEVFIILNKLKLAKEMTSLGLELIEKKKKEKYDGDFYMCAGILSGIMLTLGKDANEFKEDLLGCSLKVADELIDEYKSENP